MRIRAAIFRGTICKSELSKKSLYIAKAATCVIIIIFIILKLNIFTSCLHALYIYISYTAHFLCGFSLEDYIKYLSYLSLTIYIFTFFSHYFPKNPNPNPPVNFLVGGTRRKPVMTFCSVGELALFTCDQMFDIRLEPMTSVAGGRCLDD